MYPPSQSRNVIVIMAEHSFAPQSDPAKHDVEDPRKIETKMSKYYPEFYNSAPYLVVFDFLFRPWAYLGASKLSAVRYVVAGYAAFGLAGDQIDYVVCTPALQNSYICICRHCKYDPLIVELRVRRHSLQRDM